MHSHRSCRSAEWFGQRLRQVGWHQGHPLRQFLGALWSTWQRMSCESSLHLDTFSVMARSMVAIPAATETFGAPT